MVVIKGKDEIKRFLRDKGLKITPQRISILGAIHALENHPTAEHIIHIVRKEHPNIATGTVYKVLETFASKGLVSRVKTEGDVMRYDGITEHHHHLYCSKCDEIRDYVDEELDELLNSYFEDRELPGFSFQECVLQIKGSFDNCDSVNPK